jgi:hypothetical protein
MVHSVRGALAELRGVLPEACVGWLVLEEPHLLHGVPVSRLQQLQAAARDHADSLRHIAATADAFHQPRLRQWFQNVVGDYY